MAWTEPVTDRTQTSRCTYEDMNRISGNINYLQDSALKDDYTNDDIVTLVQWQSIVQGVADCCLKYGILNNALPLNKSDDVVVRIIIFQSRILKIIDVP